MRVPSFERFVAWLPGFGLFVAGMIVGSAAFMSVHQRNFNALVDKAVKLQNENEQLKSDIDDLNKLKNMQSIVKKVTVRTERAAENEDPDPLTENEIAGNVQRELKTIYVGQQIAEFLEPQEAREVAGVVEKRWRIKDRDYETELVSFAVVQTELIVFIRVRPFVAH